MAFSFVQTEETMKQGNEMYVVAIDPGHGGFDPGKVGVSGALEKDINLSISWKVKQQLEKKGIEVIMTRTTDQGLYEEGEKNKNRQICEIGWKPYRQVVQPLPLVFIKIVLQIQFLRAARYFIIVVPKRGNVLPILFRIV